MLTLSFIQVVILALLQGATELFPISSLGHTVILPALLHWGDIVRSTQFLPLIVALHLGTSIALIIYFWKEWLQVIKTLVDSVQKGSMQTTPDAWVGWLIIIGCIPAGLIGVYLETPLKHLFATPLIASIFLAINGLILLGGEMIKKRMSANKALHELTWKEAIFIGLAQSLALIPGISRSGSSMVAGLAANLSHEDAARYSFLLGAPVISGAALLEVPQLVGLPAHTMLLVFIGMILSGITAYFSTKFLLKYFESNNLKPFGYYCLVAGIVTTILFMTVLK